MKGNRTCIMDVPEIYPGRFPKNYREGIDGWNFTPNELEENRGRILTLDIDFGNVCDLRCEHCFRRDGTLDKKHGTPLTYEQITDFIRQAKKLGLRSVKFLGAGEPFQDRRLLDLLEFLKKVNVTPLIFTKGHVIGNDNLARIYHGHKGIKNSRDLIKRLVGLNVKILLGFRSFNPGKEDRMVGVLEYAKKRDRALRLLVEAGFNRHNPTHMGLMPLPITKDNIDEAFDIYKFARRRNMGIIVTPTMVSGRCSDMEYRKKIDITTEQKIQLFTKIYAWNIETGIQTLDELEMNGISMYAGTFPCHQIGCGMYVTLDGTVLRCPGDDTTIFGNVKRSSVKEIWEASENYRRSGTYNCGCPPKMGKTIPINLQKKVLGNLRDMITSGPTTL